MVEPIYGGAAPPRNVGLSPADLCIPHRSSAEAFESELVRPDDLAALLCALDTRNPCGLGDLVTTIPDHPRPISAVMALVDAGLLGADLGSPFGAQMAIWRTTPPRT